MSLTDIQLYANNAKSTLVLGIGASDTVMQVQSSQGSRFPAITLPGVQYFLVTLESSGIIEVVKVTARVGDTLTVERAKEGTQSSPFPIGAQVQMRVTKGTLENFARLTDRMGSIASVDILPVVSAAIGNSYIADTLDDQGNPIVATKAPTRWKYLTHGTILLTGSVNSATTLSLTSAVITNVNYAAGRYIVNFTSGALAGTSRLVTGATGTTISWATETTAAPTAGTNFEIVVSNGYQLSLIAGLSDESIINAIIFGS